MFDDGLKLCIRPLPLGWFTTAINQFCLLEYEKKIQRLLFTIKAMGLFTNSLNVPCPFRSFLWRVDVAKCLTILFIVLWR